MVCDWDNVNGTMGVGVWQHWWVLSFCLLLLSSCYLVYSLKLLIAPLQSHKSQMKTPRKHFHNFLLLVHSVDAWVRAEGILGFCTLWVPSKEGVFLGLLTDDDHQQAFTCDHHCWKVYNTSLCGGPSRNHKVFHLVHFTNNRNIITKLKALSLRGSNSYFVSKMGDIFPVKVN